MQHKEISFFFIKQDKSFPGLSGHLSTIVQTYTCKNDRVERLAYNMAHVFEKLN